MCHTHVLSLETLIPTFPSSASHKVSSSSESIPSRLPPPFSLILPENTSSENTTKNTTRQASTPVLPSHPMVTRAKSDILKPKALFDSLSTDCWLLSNQLAYKMDLIHHSENVQWVKS